jgi:DNA polymerase-3 subunit gamma/tau
MYLALARKYRPQKFADLIGQPHITRTLQNAIHLDKLYPTLIFSGMKGVGKTSAARILAKALNCEKGPAIEPCNECPTCIEITEDKSPDYIEIDGASNNGVEEVRNLKEKVKYKPFKNRFRVVVIDEVHMLSNSAWNALLKTIEEPPDFTYFVMATTDFHKIPATIVSRCQHFEFKRIPYEVITKVLREICSKENINITDYSLYLVARSGEGSLRDAKKVLDQAIAISNGDVNDKDVVDILGVIEEDLFITLTQYVLSQDRKAIIKEIHELSERGMDLRFFYNEYLKFFRNLLVLKSLGEMEDLHELNPENIPRLKEMLKNVREVELLRYFNAAKDLEITIKNTENPRIILEYLFLKLTYFPSLVSIEELIEKARSGELAPVGPAGGGGEGPGTMGARDTRDTRDTGGTSPGSREGLGLPGKESFSSAAGLDNDPHLSAERLKTLLIETVGKEHLRLASAFETSSFSLRNNLLSIQFPQDLEFAYKASLERVEYLEETILRVLHKRVEVEISLDRSKNGNEEETRKRELESDVKVNRLLDRVQGKIVSIEKIS